MKKGITKSKNMIMLITIGVIVLAIGLIALIGSMNSKGKDTAPSVEVVSVGTGNVTQEVDATGNVESEQKKTFYSPVNGTIQTMTAEAGDSVDAGKNIIGFNLENLESENQEAQLTAKSGELDIKDAQEQASTAANKVAEAQAAIPGLESQIEEKQNQINSLRQQIADAQTNAQNDAQAQIEQAQAEAKAEAEAAYKAAKDNYNQKKDIALQCAQKEEQAKTEYERATIDYTKQTIDENQLQEVADKYTAAVAETKKAEEEAKQAEGAIPEDPDESVNAMASAAGTVTADTSDLQAQMETASSDLTQLQSDLASKKAIAENDTAGLTDAAREKMTITSNLSELKSKNLQELLEEGRKGIQAEFKGVISDAKVTQGATVTQGMELFTLQSTQDVCVEANVSKYDFDKVKEGQKAEITLGDKKYKGTVDKVSKIAIPNEKGTPLIGVSVHIDNPDDDIFIGVEAKVTIQASEAKNVPVLPVEVVNIGKEGSFCYVVNKGKIEKKDIETGVTSDSMVEVKSGLKKGDQVIKDMGNYSEGDSVTAKEAKTEESKASK